MGLHFLDPTCLYVESQPRVGQAMAPAKYCSTPRVENWYYVCEDTGSKSKKVKTGHGHEHGHGHGPGLKPGPKIKEKKISVIFGNFFNFIFFWPGFIFWKPSNFC